MRNKSKLILRLEMYRHAIRSMKAWMIDGLLKTILVGMMVLRLIPVYAPAQEPGMLKPVNHRTFVPPTISAAWRSYFESVPDPTTIPPRPAPHDVQGWRRVHAEFEAQRLAPAAKLAEKLGVSLAETRLGGVKVLDIKPAGWQDDGKVLVYAHGGAYTLFSARSTLTSSAVAATATGYRVISIDYTNPPQARWQAVTDEVVSVFKALKEQGFAMKNVGFFGDSAGAGLAGGAVLKMRDLGLELPAAVVLWSPWSDITETGDTYVTLKNAEPSYIYETVLGPAAEAYADLADQKHPYVSPVYGDYARGFPPTLIQGGTRELFLSNFVRLYQAMDTAGVEVKLDLYEAMPHVFQNKLPDSAESKLALKKMKAFLDRHLGKP
jgi:acetyl esterase/lipase